MADITLIPLAPEDHEQFILDNQEAFNYGALEEFGRRAQQRHRLRSLVCGGKDAP